jgi:hypothetical protein
VLTNLLRLFENDAMKIDKFKNKNDVPAQKKAATA